VRAEEGPPATERCAQNTSHSSASRGTPRENGERAATPHVAAGASLARRRTNHSPFTPFSANTRLATLGQRERERERERGDLLNPPAGSLLPSSLFLARRGIETDATGPRVSVTLRWEKCARVGSSGHSDQGCRSRFQVQASDAEIRAFLPRHGRLNRE